MKFQRQAKVLELIEKYDIETQEDLSMRLQAIGYNTTQATISRDIKDLRLVKVLTASGKYKYAPSPDSRDSSFASRLRNIFKECVTSIDYAQNIIVIKTLPGLAMAAAAAIDGMPYEGILGTLAGDDTVMIVMRSDKIAEQFCRESLSMLT
ncbi:MAG: arginine repressor [Clostridiales bacterium]|nr:arginine repressor [Clostridiales bacterium]